MEGTQQDRNALSLFPPPSGIVAGAAAITKAKGVEMTAAIHEDKLSSSEQAVLQARADKLTLDELHEQLVSTYINIREYSIIYQALVFSAKKRMVAGEKVGGCKTWKDYVDTYLKRAGESLLTCLRRIRRLLEGVNPDKKHRNRRNKSGLRIVQREPKSTPASDPAPQYASPITARLTTFYSGLTTELAALTKGLKSNGELDERVQIEAQNLARTLRSFSKDAAERADRIDESLQVPAA